MRVKPMGRREVALLLWIEANGEHVKRALALEAERFDDPWLRLYKELDSLLWMEDSDE